jgi:hypothetical protein
MMMSIAYGVHSSAMIEVPGAATVSERGTLRGRKLTELTAAERQRVRLIELGESGYTIFRPADLDRRFRPWLVDPAGKVWAVRGGEPRGGRRRETHAIVVEDDGSWGWLTAASALQEEDTPQSLRDLEDRQKRAERAQKRKAQEHATAIRAARLSARPVLLSDVDPLTRSLPETLSGMVARVEDLGGVVEVKKGRLVVRLPGGGDEFGRRLAAALYLAEAAVIEGMRGKDGEVSAAHVEDKALLPSGKLEP